MPATPLRRPAKPPLRLLIVDDSIVARTVLARMLEARAGFAVAGIAGGTAQALALLDGGLRVDVILLDLEMPGTDGLTALPELIARSGGARVLIVSAACGTGAAATVQALTLGAADTILKPAAAAFAGRFADELAERLERIAAGDAAGPIRAAHPGAARREAPRCLCVGASTGGPHALAAFFAALDPDFAAPILVTQHLPAPFIPIFAGQLRDIARRPVAVAEDGARVSDGTILLAPGDAHLALTMRREVRVALDRRPAASGCTPSVDPMLCSAAAVYGRGVAAVILTGMGRDGAAGAAIVAEAGGEVLAQDAGSSVVWGMPGAVAGLASVIGPPALLAQRLGGRPAGARTWS